MVGVEGVIATDTKAAGVTLRVPVPDIEPEVAVIVAVPVPVDVASPTVAGAMLMVATVPADDVQCTEVVRSWVLPSL
jgi:hypothetical protein